MDRRSTSLNVVQHQIQSDGLISDLCSQQLEEEENGDESNDSDDTNTTAQQQNLEKKLEKTWTLMLSHLSRMDTQSIINENAKDLDYLNMQRNTIETLKIDQSSSKSNDYRSLSRKSGRRTSFFGDAAISMHTERSILREQSLRVRLMNKTAIRWLYHFASRATALSDQITDLVLLISLITSGANQQASIYVCFLTAPYLVLSLLLLAPLSRRMGVIIFRRDTTKKRMTNKMKN